MTLVYLNAFICGLISIRLMFFRQQNCQHKTLYSLLAYILIVASASITIRALTHQTHFVDLPEVILNSIVCYLVFTSRGNIASIFRNTTR